MRRYRCDNEVEAGKVEQILTERRPDGNTRIRFVDGETIEVGSKIFAKGFPAIGDYIVIYEGFYVTWWPAKNFENAYTLIEGD